MTKWSQRIIMLSIYIKYFFSNIVNSLHAPKFKGCYPLSERISQPPLNTINKSMNHPSPTLSENATEKVINFFLP